MKTVQFDICPCGKRGWSEERDAEKALGRSQSMRRRAADKSGTRRGSRIENRIYWCETGECFHLTQQSRRSYDTYAELVAA